MRLNSASYSGVVFGAGGLDACAWQAAPAQNRRHKPKTHVATPRTCTPSSPTPPRAPDHPPSAKLAYQDRQPDGGMAFSACFSIKVTIDLCNCSAATVAPALPPTPLHRQEFLDHTVE